jgi:hypothetical protein
MQVWAPDDLLTDQPDGAVHIAQVFDKPHYESQRRNGRNIFEGYGARVDALANIDAGFARGYVVISWTEPALQDESKWVKSADYEKIYRVISIHVTQCGSRFARLGSPITLEQFRELTQKAWKFESGR